MVDFYIDPLTKDLDIQGGQIRLTEKETGELTRQRVDITLNTYRGEWFANILFGVPYIINKNNKVQILGKVDKTTFDIYIREAILSVDEVDYIEFYNSSIDDQTRQISINTRIIDEGGQAIDISDFIIQQ